MRQCIPRFALPCFASTLYCSLSPCHRLHIFHFSNNLHSHSLSICRTNGIMQIGHTKLFHISNVYVHMFIEPLSASHAVPDCSIQLAFWGTHTHTHNIDAFIISIHQHRAKLPAGGKLSGIIYSTFEFISRWSLWAQHACVSTAIDNDNILHGRSYDVSRRHHLL